MKTYKLVYRASHREANSTFIKPRFRLQLPENVLSDGTNKDIEVVLEQFSGYIKKDANALDDAVVLKIGQPAFNSVQTNGVGTFDGGQVLGIANMTHSHTGENFVTVTNISDYGLRFKSNIFNNGFVDFKLEQINGADVEIPATAAFREYTIVLCVKVLE